MIDIEERLRNHVNHRGGPTLENSAWQMMLEAAAEILRLRAELATAWKEAEEQNEAVCEVLRKIGDMRSERDALRAENEKLRAALKPFAETSQIRERASFSASYLLAAAAALKET